MISISIVTLPIWEQLKQYLHVVECAKDGGLDEPRIRIEFLGVPQVRMHEYVMLSMPCVACLRPNHPLRRREGDAWDMGRLYYAPACALTTRMACSRGRAAELEYERFKGIASGLPADRGGQLQLF